jgi:tetratricopeptide (TPR) repeat protein
MLDAAGRTGSAWEEMWGRLWRIDTLFEAGQLRSVQRELADLEICLERVRSPASRWHLLEAAATLAQATGRFTEAMRLAGEAFTLMGDMSYYVAFGARAAILSQVGWHIGCEASGLPEHWGGLPGYFQPEAVDTTRGLATVFPALTVAQIHLDRGDSDGAAAAYALAGPLRSWTPSPAMRMSSWAFALPAAIGLDRQEDIEFVAAGFEPLRGRHVANGAGTGVYMGPVELQLGLAAAALGRLDAAVADLQAAVSICDANGACGYSVQASVELASALARRQAPGDQDRARAILDRVGPEADRLGMVPFSERTARLRTQLPAAEAVRSPLSTRELEVARLVARGLTNKQIGLALYVSERTAENHV